jgi:hypothetical protein
MVLISQIFDINTGVDCDITQDTPVEILHTVLLGIVKYSWHGTHTSWKDAEKSLYAPRLQSTDTKGLSIPAIRAGYIMQYANSLIGRQLKILAQTNAFHVHDLVTEDEYQLIKAIGVLAALLWVPEIRDMDEYLVSFTLALALWCVNFNPDMFASGIDGRRYRGCQRS